MRSSRRIAVFITVCLALMPAILPSAAAASTATRRGTKVFALVNIDRIGFERLETLKRLPQIEGWAELDDNLLVYGEPGFERSIPDTYTVRIVADGVRSSDLRILCGHDVGTSGARVLASGGRSSVVLGTSAQFQRLAEIIERDADCGRSPHADNEMHPFVPNLVLAHQAANDDPLSANKIDFNVSVQSLVDSVNGDRWFADIQTLANFGTRYSGRSGNIAARDWLVQQFQAMPGLSVSTQQFTFGSTTSYNVVATLTGTTRPDDWYIVGGHFDSRSQTVQTADTAPGAEDNGSGTAAVLEEARILTANPPDATVIFICYSGEEQGLFGSIDHASDLVASGDNAHIRAVQIMDMIGYTGDSDLDCLLETGSIGQSMQSAYAAAAAQYTTLRIVTSLNPFGSDHVPYLDRGMPALLLIENDWDSYPSYHRTTDTPSNITIDMGVQIMRMDIAALAQMVGTAPAGNGSETVGIYDPATGNFFLKNSNAPGSADVAFQFAAGGQGYVPLAGDWNGDGLATIGVYSPTTGTFFLKNSNSGGPADVVVSFGPGGSSVAPIVGDWDGNGTDTVGIYNSTSGTFFLKNSNTPGAADLAFTYGPAGATAVVGDWDGNGTDTIGIYVPATGVFFLRNTNAPGNADLTFSYGAGGAGLTPVIGDWNNDNSDTVGLYQGTGGSFFLRNSNTAGNAAVVFGYGPSSGVRAVAGDWDNH